MAPVHGLGPIHGPTHGYGHGHGRCHCRTPIAAAAAYHAHGLRITRARISPESIDSGDQNLLALGVVLGGRCRR